MDAPLLTPTDLDAVVATLTLRDEHRFSRRLAAARSIPDEEKRRNRLDALTPEVAAAARRVRRRQESVPVLSYPPELPISQRRDDIAAAIRDHQVVVVAGETGSGKTTQIPKICLELGRGIRGVIGHTQPRRLAARTVAERIAEELSTPLGGAVGYTVRFTDQAGDDTLVRLMTDGILLAEIQRDRDLRRYDTIIIDEAHERSLNIDFLLGYLAQLLPRRPDLKLIITSATIDPARFARHFGGAPIVEVSGRTYPVEIRYRPVIDPDDPAADPDRDQTQAVLDAVAELARAGPGDVLVFLSGEREIRDTADALEKQLLRDTEIVPLYARLSAAEQHKVFQPHTGRRVVLATNVAETSLTVPGIKYVVDPGTARISRYSQRTKVQRLPIEAISQASANQRAGRCGRTSDGICIRLYSAADYASRPEFTEPEILRTNLASVLLQMTALDLGDLAAFPFVDPPDRRNVTAGVQLLEELGAFDPGVRDTAKRLTPLGRTLAQLPIDPRLGRMVLEADRNGCLHEVMVIAAAMSIQDPRERPADAQQAADTKHRRFADPNSDFLAYLSLWRYLQAQRDELSGSAFRRLCKAEFLHYLRVREWQDLYGQLRQVVRGLGLEVPNRAGADPPATLDADGAVELVNTVEAGDAVLIHKSLLAGLLSHVGLKDVDRVDRDGRPGARPRRASNEYLGARSAKFMIFPGSALAKKPPRWVVAGELVETSRLFARTVARIEPEWVEQLAGHLVVRTYSEPHWEARRGAVMATEKVTLYGVPLVVGRRVTYSSIDPELSRELFIRHALVEGDWKTHHTFFHENLVRLADAEELEHRARRRGLVVDDETLFAFYDQRLGPDVVSAAHFDTWWKKTRRARPDLLNFSPSMLVDPDTAGVSSTDYPDAWTVGDLALPLAYAFEPGTAQDGVTVTVPLPVLNQVGPAMFDWQVPGLRHELVTALIRSLPKELRRNFVPAPDVASAVLADVSPADGPLIEAVTASLHRLTGFVVPRDAWQLENLPAHLRPVFRVVAEDGTTVLAEGRDLTALRQSLEPQMRAALASAVGPSVATVNPFERSGARAWEFGELPRTVERQSAGYLVKGYPALVDEGTSVGVRVLESEAGQARSMWAGTRRLLLLSVAAPNKAVVGRLSNPAKLALSRNPHGSVPALLADCAAAAVDSLITAAGGPAWDEPGFAALREQVRAELVDTTLAVLKLVETVLDATRQASDELVRVERMPAAAGAVADIRAQLAALVYPGFVAATGAARLRDVGRYVRGIVRRIEGLARDPGRDRGWQVRVEQVQAVYRDWLSRLPADLRTDDAVLAVRWMIEELRVSLFAQALGTAHPVSEQRIYRAMDAAGGGVRV